MLGTPQSECRALGLIFAFEFARKSAILLRNLHFASDRRDCHAGGREFEPRRPRHLLLNNQQVTVSMERATVARLVPGVH